ncbi:MAG: TolC family outer membrane protein [Pseudomonas sp.]|jgi:outer membrane protein|uniref:TolC family outer membrane protein n=1 Tax=Pseudomonas sp. TaxID=306 RepID=UPI00271EB3CB|nr:TolC family outer membrane protein [Pseudomonas sp.]MDO9327498.1 TolC family outer membrane protein [Pseudomonas sp.]
MILRLFPCAVLSSLVLPVDAADLKLAQPSSAAPRTTSVSKQNYSIDLMQLYRESRLEDPRVIASYSKAQSGVEQQNQAFGSLLPSVTANAGFNRIKQTNLQVDEAYNSRNYTVGLTQPLYNKAAWENYQHYKSLAKQADSESREAQAEATVDMAQRYFAALAADDELELVQAERRATQKNLDMVTALYSKQLAMITDLLDLKSRVDSLAAQEVDARNQSSLSRVALAEIVGRPVNEKLSRVRNDVELKVSADSLESWVNLAITENPSIKASESAQEAAEAALRASKGGHYPTVNLNLSAQQTNEGYNNSLAPQTDSYVAGVGVQIPIYSGGSTSARVRQLYQDQLTAEQQLVATRRQVVKELTNSYLTADSSAEKIRANRNALASAEQSRIAAEKAFTYGVVNAVDVLTSVQNEFKARRDLLKTQYDFITNLFILNRWAGKLSEESVESVNVWLSSNDQADMSQRPQSK